MHSKVGPWGRRENDDENNDTDSTGTTTCKFHTKHRVGDCIYCVVVPVVFVSPTHVGAGMKFRIKGAIFKELEDGEYGPQWAYTVELKVAKAKGTLAQSGFVTRAQAHADMFRRLSTALDDAGEIAEAAGE